jgi:hypothetical protein
MRHLKTTAGKSHLSLQKVSWKFVPILMLLGAVAEFLMGRKLWGIGGKPGVWSGDIWSEHNSQYLFDPYTLTHITHGVLLYGILLVALKRVPVNIRLLLAVAIESSWEVLENSAAVIERYRTETISLNYYGDSVVNSMCDILACILGFLLASRLPKRVTIIGAIALEILLLIWTRDNLALNILMLIRPSQAIRMWQLGK